MTTFLFQYSTLLIDKPTILPIKPREKYNYLSKKFFKKNQKITLNLCNSYIRKIKEKLSKITHQHYFL